jgi:predicted enzyme related to lactoylglutathione lyase
VDYCRYVSLSEAEFMASPQSVQSVDMKFEIVVLAVADVDRAKEFYARLGWRLDADFASGNEFRIIQFTPPGSGCSIMFGMASPR